MQLRPAFPVDAVGGACFVTLRHEVPPEGVIDLDCDLDTMPAWGRLCLLPQAVRAMNELLGWKIDTGESTPTKQLRATIGQLTAENEQLRAALTDISAHAHAAVAGELVESG